MDDKQAILELIEVIEEQQALIAELLQTYEAKNQVVKDEILAASKRIEQKTANLKQKVNLLTDEETTK